MAKGSEATFDFNISWPLKCAPLARRHEPDEFARIFPAPLESLHYAIELPSGCQARFDTFGLKDGAARYEVKSSVTKHGRTRIALTAEGVHAHRRVGMRIDPM